MAKRDWLVVGMCATLAFLPPGYVQIDWLLILNEASSTENNVTIIGLCTLKSTGWKMASSPPHCGTFMARDIAPVTQLKVLTGSCSILGLKEPNFFVFLYQLRVWLPRLASSCALLR